MSLLLLGDLGGTNVRFSLHRVDTAQQQSENPALSEPVLQGRYHVKEFESLEDMVLRFLETVDEAGSKSEQSFSRKSVVGLSMSVCGPVVKGSAVLLAAAFGKQGWKISEASVQAATGLSKVMFLNDFHAVGLAMSTVPKADIVCLWEGQGRSPSSPIAVLGPGTGLGQCYGVTVNGVTSVCCSEGGMSDFVPRTEQEWALRMFIANQDETPFVEVEKVVSGQGIFNIYKFLAAQAANSDLVDDSLDADIRRSKEPAAVIAQHSGHQEGIPTSKLCADAINLFIQCLGVELGNLAVR